MAYLLVHYPDGRKMEFPLRVSELSVGRDESCDIPLHDAMTSREHAKLTRDTQGRYWIDDLQSKNGVCVNEKPIRRSQLHNGDRIGIGTFLLTFCDDAPTTVTGVDPVAETQSGTTSTWRPDERLVLPQKRLETLYELNERLTGRLERDDLLKELLSLCTEQLRFERAGIAIWAGEQHPLHWVHLRNLSTDTSGEFRISRSLVDRSLHQAERILIIDTEDAEFDPTASMVTNNIMSAMCVPMEYLQNVRGIIYGDRVTSIGGYTREDLDFFAALGRLGAMGLANVQLVEEIKQRQQVETQLQLARQIQSNLFPAGPLDVGGLHIHALNDPGQKVSGDYYDFFTREDGQIVVVIADVVGKGVPASLLMANLQAAVHVLMAKETNLAGSVGELNRLICRNVDNMRFITAIFGLLDPARRRLTYVNAGHPGPYLIRGEETVEKRDEPETNLPVGLEPDFEFRVGAIELPDAPSTLLFYTDGVPEAQNEQGDQFQEYRLLAALEANLAQAPEELVMRLRRSIKQFTRNHPQTDDITIVAARLD